MEVYMSQFENVTLIKAANIYYEGAVTSRTIILESGEKKTLGIMMPGTYEFGTDKKEIMEIQSGQLKIQLPGDDNWISIDGAYTFEVAAHSSFKLEIYSVTDYICSYVD
jgi:uncharacterized protein YaiE (UPF0345 family)